jgi:hypothetical protein
MKIALLSAALLFSSFMLLSCKKDNPIPPGEQPQISLILEDASCTEAWIKLTTANISLPADVELLKDDSPAGKISLTSADTLLYIDSLLPNHIYKYQSVIQSAGQTSNLITVTTMDTTSHNFTWQSWTFGGQAGSCTLYDVAIINENDIWAAGEIYLLDTLGQPDPKPYNLARWNGFTWELYQIPFEYNGSNSYGPIYSIYAFSSSDIWLGIGSMIHWDGIKFNSIKVPDIIFPSKANELWGTSSNDLYVVGNSGNIVRYDGQNWSKVESGTDLNINDIWGYSDNLGNKLILCAASDLGTNHQKKLLKINNNSVDTLNWPPQKVLYTVWFNSVNKIYTGGGKTYSSCGNEWMEQIPVNFFTYKIRGNDFNDIIAVGGHFSHFNGYTWQEIPELSLAGGNYESIATKGSISCAVGYSGNKAIAAIINK